MYVHRICKFRKFSEPRGPSCPDNRAFYLKELIEDCFIGLQYVFGVAESPCKIPSETPRNFELKTKNFFFFF
jgi:hypothetical protein